MLDLRKYMKSSHEDLLSDSKPHSDLNKNTDASIVQRRAIKRKENKIC
jgi:hypothetical protein